MELSKRDVAKLEKIIVSLQMIISEASKRSASGKNVSVKAKRVRRTGKELVAFRKMLKSERKKGASVASLAKKHGISSAYIYSL